MKLLVKGSISKVGITTFDRAMFNAGIISNGKLLAEGPVDENGIYSFNLEADQLPDTMELALYPASLNAEEAGTMAVRHPIKASQIIKSPTEKDSLELPMDVKLPRSFLDSIIRRAKQYHIYGNIYVQHPTWFETLAGCRIDFYEVDSIKESPDLLPSDGRTFPELIRRKDYLGTAYTDTSGSYSFKFRFGVPGKKPGTIFARKKEFSPFIPVTPDLLPTTFDAKPDIRARFLQFVNGEWKKVYEAPMTSLDWNIDTDFHRDYTIPVDEIMPTASSGIAPTSGFRFHTIGLLPVDTTRIIDGYAFAQPGDPCGTFSCHPFCGTLRVYGLFAAAHAVSYYTVELLKTDTSGSALSGETWQPLEDTLKNLEWNDTVHRWTSVDLGPTDGKFNNVDILPENSWLEHSLKVMWRTTNYVDGYYKLRITGYNASDTQVAQEELPMLRIDNSLPTADIDINTPAATICGDVALDSSRTITFRVTGYDFSGHVDDIYLYGTRGRYGETAGSSITLPRPDATLPWQGVTNELVAFPLAPRSSSTITCTTMAYGFHVRVQGLGTNGYTINLEDKRVWKHTNLVVTEPTV